MTDRENRHVDWPGWLEPLRPDSVTRARMRRDILVRAAPLLEARRPIVWQEIAAGWSSTLVPLAAALIVVFAGLAYNASRAAETTLAERAPNYGLEELVAPGDRPPDVLTSAREPDSDVLLTEVISYREPASRR